MSETRKMLHDGATLDEQRRRAARLITRAAIDACERDEDSAFHHRDEIDVPREPVIELPADDDEPGNEKEVKP